MSGPADQILTTAPGTTGQLPRQHNPTNSGSGNSQKSTGTSVIDIPRNETYSDSKKSRSSALRSVLKKLPLRSVLKKLPDISLCDIKVFLDPMLLYSFTIHLDPKHRPYLYFDKVVGLTICAINIFLEFADQFPFGRLRHCNGLPNIKRVLHPHGLPKISIKQLITFYNVCLQIPSLVVFMILCRVRMTKTVVLLMLALMVLRYLKSLSQMQKWYRTLKTSAKPWSGFTLFVFFYGAFCNFISVIWYTLAMYRTEYCWNEAIGISDPDEYCSGNTTSNTTSFNFGIYRDAYGVVQMKTFVYKILYCFRWALQNLSIFGQGLQPDIDDPIQDFFVIAMILMQIFLLSFIVGKFQIFLQYPIKRNEMIEKKLHEIEQWLPFKSLSVDLQSEVKNYYKKLWNPTKGHNGKHLFCDLPQYLRQKLIPVLCKDPLKKVVEFRSWNEQPTVNDASLADLFECVKLVSYEEDTNIIRKGDPIDKAIFVLKGELWIYTPTDATTSGSPSNASSDHRNDFLINGNFCGQELISQLQAEPYTLNLRVSDKSIQAATKVEAFVLRACDLKKIFIKRHEAQLASQQAANNSARSQP